MTNGLTEVDFDSIRKAKISLGISVRFVKKTLEGRRQARGSRHRVVWGGVSPSPAE